MRRNLCVLLVEDNQDIIELFRRDLEWNGHTLLVAHSIVEAIKILTDREHGSRFLYCLVDIHLGSGKDKAGIPILNVIREIASHRTLACAMTGDTSEETIDAATAAGARIVFPKPILPHVIRKQFEGTDLEEVIHKATHTKMTDHLNYDRFEEMVCADIKFAIEDRTPGVERSFCLMSMDADDFGLINKRFSHRTGDSAIKMIGRILEERFRFDDWVCHKSGDEFLVWLRGTKLETALQIAANIEERIAAAEVRHSDHQLIPVSISVGVTKVDLEEMRHLTDREKVSCLMEQAEVGPYGLNKAKGAKKAKKRSRGEW
jgi:diguanylate cyclase (GGDEF)-like protein